MNGNVLKWCGLSPRLVGAQVEVTNEAEDIEYQVRFDQMEAPSIKRQARTAPIMSNQHDHW